MGVWFLSGELLSLVVGEIGEHIVAESESRLSLVVGLDDGVSLDVEGLSDFKFLGGDVGFAILGDVLHVLDGHGLNGCCKH